MCLLMVWSLEDDPELQGLSEISSIMSHFLNNDHRLVVATLKLQLKSGRMGPSQPILDVGKLKDERVAEEFVNRLSGDLGGLGALGES